MRAILFIGCMVVALSACNSSTPKTQNVVTPTPGGLPTATSQPVASGEKPKLNPEHGQPFHDCALPVGAPLTADNASPATSPTSATTEAAPQQEVRLNPPHGEPGHKCEVAVGAPLS